MSDILLDKIIQNTKEFLNKQAFYSFCYRYPEEWLKLIITSIMGEKKYEYFTNHDTDFCLLYTSDAADDNSRV